MDSSLIRNIEEVPVNVENVDLNPSIDEVEYLQLKSDFFEDQTELWNKLIIKEEEAILKEIQELTEKFNERKIEKERLIRILNDLKVEADSLQFGINGKIVHLKSAITKTNGFYICPYCQYKLTHLFNIKTHIAAIHLKLKSWKCSDCNKGLFLNIHNILVIF